MQKSKLLIATNNVGKRQEFQDLLKDLAVELVTPAEIHLSLNVVEDGATYAGNAIKKALAFARASGLPSLADDSGLEVDALNGAPGLYSARYLQNPGATDGDRRAYLLQNLHAYARPWKAHFVAALALADPTAGMRTSQGACRGQIIPDERGHGGFGYDKIFLLDELPLTMAELSRDQKNTLSHRARAVAQMLPQLKQMLGVQ